MEANVASETQALPPAPGSRWQTGRVPHRDVPDRRGTARRSGEPMFSSDPRWGGYPPANFVVHTGPADVRTLPATPFTTLGPAEPGLEPVHTMIQDFSAVADYRMYRLDNNSRFVTSGDAGRIAKYVQRCRGIRPTMRSFDGTDPIQLLPFLKDIRITFNSQHLTEGVAVRVLAHFLERDGERLYTSYTMRGLRAGQLHDEVSGLGLVNQFLKHYLTEDVLGEAYDAVATARQQSHETESTFADRLETAAFRCTEVFSEQSLAHYFVRGVAPATRAAVSETIQQLPSRQKIDLPTIRRIATAEGTTHRARRNLPMPDPKPVGRAGRTTKSATTSAPASTLHVGEDEWQADPVFITQGAGPVGGRPPSSMSTGTTSSYATAFAATSSGARVMDPRVAELDILNGDAGGEAPRVPLLTDDEARHAATFASTNGSAYACWLCRTYGHAMYACPFLSPEQRMFTAYRNYRYQMDTRPGARNLLGQSVDEGRPLRQCFSNRSGGGAHFAPGGGGYRRTERDRRNRPDYRQADTKYPRRGGRGDRGRSRLPQQVQKAIMYLQDWAEDPYPLPAEGHEGEPVPPVPQILRRPIVAARGQEVPEYFANDARPQWGNRPDPRGQGPEEGLATDTQDVSSDSTVSSKKG